MEDTINELISMWYEYLASMHFGLENDTYFAIERAWSYGEKPKWKVVYRFYGGDSEKVVDSYEDALDKLVSLLRKIFEEEYHLGQKTLRDYHRYKFDNLAFAIKIAKQAIKNWEKVKKMIEKARK
jgi:hypothetical protein